MKHCDKEGRDYPESEFATDSSGVTWHERRGDRHKAKSGGGSFPAPDQWESDRDDGSD